MLERIRHLIRRRQEDGPRVDVGPMFRGEAPTNLSDHGVIDGADAVNRLPSRDYIGDEPTDLTPDRDVEGQLWERERERYKEKNQESGPAD